MAAVSVGVVQGAPLLDLCYEEDSQADVDMNIVMTGKDQFIEFQASAERQVFDENHLQIMISLARKGLQELLASQRSAVKGLSYETSP